MSVINQSVGHQWRKIGIEVSHEEQIENSTSQYDEGYAQGLEDAKAAHETERQVAQRELESLCQALGEATSAAREQASLEVVRMVQTLFESMLDIHLFQSTEKLTQAADIVSANLEFGEDEGLNIFLHPNHWPAVAEFARTESRYELVKDDSVSIGAVRVGNHFVTAELNIMHSVSELLSRLNLSSIDREDGIEN